MDWLTKLRTENAIQELKSGFDTLREIIGAYNIQYAEGILRVQVNSDELEKIRQAFKKVACLEILSENKIYPYRRYLIIDGVEIFSLDDRPEEELKEAS